MNPVLHSLKALLILPLLSLSAMAESNYELELQSGQFLTPWDGYQNQSLHFQGGFFLRSERWNAMGEIRLSNDRLRPVLGNIESLLYSPTEWLSIGRMGPLESYISHISIHDRLNQKICYTSFECTRGGPIGLHLGSENLRLGLTLVNIPSLSPTPSLDEEGRAQGASRWSVPPYHTVNTGSDEFPLRNSLSYPDGTAAFFKPGARLDHAWEGELGRMSFTHAYEVTRNPVGGTSHRVMLIDSDEPAGTAVLENQIALRFPYEHIHSAQHTVENKFIKLSTEATYSRVEFVERGSAFSEISSELGGFTPSIGGGWIATDKNDPFVQAGLKYKTPSWTFYAPAQVLLKPARRALAFSPQVDYLISKKAGTVFLRAELIEADEKAPFYGRIRGNDRVLLGYRHVY